jgi:hypothetical protein
LSIGHQSRFNLGKYLWGALVMYCLIYIYTVSCLLDICCMSLLLITANDNYMKWAVDNTGFNNGECNELSWKSLNHQKMLGDMDYVRYNENPLYRRSELRGSTVHKTTGYQTQFTMLYYRNRFIWSIFCIKRKSLWLKMCNLLKKLFLFRAPFS